jgi:uncharacterized protein (DUF305 family)
MLTPAPPALTTPRRLALVLCGLFLGLLVSSCVGTAEPDSRPYNDADVAFATHMVQHHAQALQLVDLTIGRKLDPEVQTLAEEIRAAQAPEIERMVDWLQDWDEPVPETVRDHANAHGHGTGPDTDMPGMVSQAMVEELAALDGAEFQRTWLSMMVAHHEGAIEMAEQEQATGRFDATVALAAQIVKTQSAEIERMRRLLQG